MAISEGQWVKKTVWKAERAWFLDQRKRRAKPGIEPFLTDLWPSPRTQISEDSKGVCSLGRRARFYILPEKGRQRVRESKRALEGGRRSAFPSKEVRVRLNLKGRSFHSRVFCLRYLEENQKKKSFIRIIRRTR